MSPQMRPFVSLAAFPRSSISSNSACSWLRHVDCLLIIRQPRRVRLRTAQVLYPRGLRGLPRRPGRLSPAEAAAQPAEDLVRPDEAEDGEGERTSSIFSQHLTSVLEILLGSTAQPRLIKSCTPCNHSSPLPPVSPFFSPRTKSALLANNKSE